MAAPTDHPMSEEQELQRLAEAIADGEPAAGRVSADRATSPLLRQMSVIAEAAGAFQDAGPAPGSPAAAALFRWGPLEVRRNLGEGSFGEVYAAWDSRLRREVALKLRRGEVTGDTRRWLDEARALAAVRHPNVLTIHGADEHDGRVGMWTHLVTGRDLETILQQHGPFSAREAVSIGLELCSALAAVHARGLVHGDVKTRNVMRDEGGDSPGRIVLMDFGSAHEASLEVTAGRGLSIGTPLAMAPEVLRGEAATPASDLYSLGVLLFRLVSGRYPVEAATLEELRGKHERREHAALRTLRPELPAEFVRVVERALEPDPRDRFADAAAMERALHGPLAAASPARAGFYWLAAALLAVVVLAPWVWSTLDRALDRKSSAAGATGAGSTTPAAPPATAATGAPPATAASAPEVEAALYRVTAGSREALHTGDLVAPGDRMSLELESRVPVYTYVLDEDERGGVFVLFPLHGRGATNPLEAGQRQRLPGREGSADLDWEVTSAGGRETILIIASATPLAPVEDAAASMPHAVPGAPITYASLAPESLARLRGIGGVTRETALPEAARAGKLAQLAHELSRPGQTAPVWMRLVVLENPAP